MAMPERSWFIAEGKGGRHRMSHPVIDARRWRVTRPAPQPRPTLRIARQKKPCSSCIASSSAAPRQNGSLMTRH
jgi:hypothetical protein